MKFFRGTPQSITKRGLWPLDALKMYPRLPRIHLDDLLRMIEKANEIYEENNALNQAQISSNFVFVDCRCKDDIALFGAISSSVKFEEFYNGLSQDLPAKSTSKARIQQPLPQLQRPFNHHLVIVVNSVDNAMTLIEKFIVPRVCYLELNQHVPKLLLA